MASGDKNFGRNIKRLREKRGYSQEELAEIVGLEYQTISRIETGYYFTNFENLRKISNALGVQIRDLFEPENTIKKEELEERISDLIKDSNEAELDYIYKMIVGLKLIRK